MGKYILNRDKYLNYGIRNYLLTAEQLDSIIKENNTSYEIYTNTMNEVMIICDNKPRDVPVVGIEWLTIAS